MSVDNYSRHAQFREAVALVMNVAGVATATPKPRRPARSTSEHVELEDRDAPDVLGVHRFHLNVTSAESARWGSALDSALVGARLAGKMIPAVVAYRRGRPIAQSFVLMRLEDFAAMLAKQTEAAS